MNHGTTNDHFERLSWKTFHGKFSDRINIVPYHWIMTQLHYNLEARRKCIRNMKRKSHSSQVAVNANMHKSEPCNALRMFMFMFMFLSTLLFNPRIMGRIYLLSRKYVTNVQRRHDSDSICFVNITTPRIPRKSLWRIFHRKYCK